MEFKKIITSPFKWGKNQAKTFTDFDMHFKKGGTFSKGVVDEFKAQKEQVNKKYRKESFEEASERMNLSEADLKDAYDYHKNMFRLWFSLGILASVIILTVVVHHRYLTCLPAIAFIILAFGNCYRNSYNCYCINHRSLKGIERWKKAKEWFPRPFVFKDKAQMAISKNRTSGKSSSKLNSQNKDSLRREKRLEGGK